MSIVKVSGCGLEKAAIYKTKDSDVTQGPFFVTFLLWVTKG